MQYEVPQYIEEEAKIAGPFTIRQFFILFGGVLLCAVFFSMFNFGTALVISIFILGGVSMLMLGKYNGRKLSDIALAALKHLWIPKTYVWHKKELSSRDIFVEEQRRATVEQPKREPIAQSLSKEQLKQIAQQLDRKETT